MANPLTPDFSAKLAKRFGVPPANIVAVLGPWAPYEGGSADNPLNTTLKMPGSTSFNSIGVQRYGGNIDAGVDATYRTLINDPLYKPIVDAIKAGQATPAMAPAVRYWTSGKTDGASNYATVLEGGKAGAESWANPSASASTSGAASSTNPKPGAAPPSGTKSKNGGVVTETNPKGLTAAQIQEELFAYMAAHPDLKDSGSTATLARVVTPAGTKTEGGRVVTAADIQPGGDFWDKDDHVPALKPDKTPYAVGDVIGGKSVKVPEAVDTTATKLLQEFYNAQNAEKELKARGATPAGLTAAETFLDASAKKTADQRNAFQTFADRADELYKLQDADQAYAARAQADNIAYGAAAKRGEVRPNFGDYFVGDRPGSRPGTPSLSELMRGSIGTPPGPPTYDTLPDISGYMPGPQGYDPSPYYPPSPDPYYPSAGVRPADLDPSQLPQYAMGTTLSGMLAKGGQGGGKRPTYPNGKPIPPEVLAMVGVPLFADLQRRPGEPGIPDVSKIRAMSGGAPSPTPPMAGGMR